MTLRPILSIALALALLAAAAGTVNARNLDASGDVVVAYIDTGINPFHEAFDYDGDGSTPDGQLVAWWDFSNEKAARVMPGPGETWDPRHAPYDTNGHGTAVASRIGGHTGTSLAPGVKMAVAKVGDADGTLRNITDAYRWAVHEVKADVVSISIGSIVPLPGLFSLMDDEIAAAMRGGVLTVVSAGNGMGNACGPTFSWAHSNGHSRDALSVGSVFDSGNPSVLLSCSSFQPDVAAPGMSVRAACPEKNDCYRRISGTSFAAPYVAGATAKLLETAIAHGNDRGPWWLKDLVVSCADTSMWSHVIVGMGVFKEEAFARALPHAAAGTLCGKQPAGSIVGQAVQPTDAPLHDASYTARWGMTEATDFGGQFLVRAADAPTDAGTMGAGSFAGVVEAHTYTVDLAFGEPYALDLTWDVSDGVTDLDVYMIPARAVQDDVILIADHVAKSTNAAGETESIAFRAPEPGTYVVLVVGWLVPADTPYTLDAPGATFQDTGLYAGHMLI